MSNGIIIKSEDELLTEIKSIKDISFIKIYDLTSFELDDNRRIVLPCIMVQYGRNKFFNLKATDKYFEQLLFKVQEVYLKEKDRIVESRTPVIDLKPGIEIDERTKKILLSNNLDREDDIYKLYNEKNGYDYSLFFEKDELESMLPLIKYHIKNLFEKTNVVFNFKDESKLVGYRKNYSTNAVIDGVEDKVLIRFNRLDNNEYKVDIRTLKKSVPPVSEEIKISTDKIDVATYIDGSNLLLTSTYEFINTPSKEERLVKDDKALFYKKEELEKSECPYLNIVNMDSDFTGDWYKLPWDAYFGIDEKIEQIGALEKNVKRDSKYVSVNGNNFIIHDDYSKKFVIDKTLNARGAYQVMDRSKKVIKGKKLDRDTFVIETLIYDSFYDNKYFYHLARTKNIDGLKKENLLSVSKDEDVVYSGDLYDSMNVSKVLRKEHKNGNIK